GLTVLIAGASPWIGNLSILSFDLLQHHVQPLASGDAGAVRLAPHQSAGEVAIGDEQEARGQRIAPRRLDRHLDLSGLAPEPHPIARRQPQALHVLRRDLQDVRLFLILLLELPFADAAPLPAGATGDEDERLWHHVGPGRQALSKIMDDGPWMLRIPLPRL